MFLDLALLDFPLGNYFQNIYTLYITNYPRMCLHILNAYWQCAIFCRLESLSQIFTTIYKFLQFKFLSIWKQFLNLQSLDFILCALSHAFASVDLCFGVAKCPDVFFVQVPSCPCPFSSRTK